jgi:hypothetical protein
MARILNEGMGQGAYSKIASNSLDINSWDFVSMTSWFIVKSWTTWKIEGVSKTDKVFAADNQTVAKANVVYVPSEGQLTVEVVADATIAQADVGSYFNINANWTVDVATKSTTGSYVDTSDAWAGVDAVIYMQVKLVKVINTLLWEFKIVNY